MSTPDLIAESAEQLDPPAPWPRRMFLITTGTATAITSICGLGFLLNKLWRREETPVQGYLVDPDVRNYILAHVQGINERPDQTVTGLLTDLRDLMVSAYRQTFPSYGLDDQALSRGISVIQPAYLRNAAEANNLLSINEPLPPVITYFDEDTASYQTLVAPYSAIFAEYLEEGNPGNVYLELIAHACSNTGLPQRQIADDISFIGYRLHAPKSSYNRAGEICNIAIANFEQRMLLVQGLGLAGYGSITTPFDKATELLFAIARSNGVDLTALLVGHRNSNYHLLNRALNLNHKPKRLTLIDNLLIDLTLNPDKHPDPMEEYYQIRQ